MLGNPELLGTIVQNLWGILCLKQLRTQRILSHFHPTDPVRKQPLHCTIAQSSWQFLSKQDRSAYKSPTSPISQLLTLEDTRSKIFPSIGAYSFKTLVPSFFKPSTSCDNSQLAPSLSVKNSSVQDQAPKHYNFLLYFGDFLLNKKVHFQQGLFCHGGATEEHNV